MVCPDLYNPVPLNPLWSRGRCDVFAGWLLPRRYGCHPKRLWGSREGTIRLETPTLHICTPAGSGSWDPSVGSRVLWRIQRGAITWPKAPMAGGGRAPAATPLCACTLVPDLLPCACTHMHATPLHARVLSHSISPTSSHAVGTLFFGVASTDLALRLLMAAGLFLLGFLLPPTSDSCGAGERYYGSCTPPVPGLSGVGRKPAGC